MLVSNMRSPKGNPVPNQYIISDENCVIFQSCETTIAIFSDHIMTIGGFWDYSKNTMKYLYIFLNAMIGGTWNKKAVLDAIKDGYIIYNPSMK